MVLRCSSGRRPNLQRVPGSLILCATPIGNLDDVSPRLREALAGADVVYAEDTRRSRVLLEHLGVKAVLRSFFVGNEKSRADEIGARLQGGERVALITDAGTPGISDPGLSAVKAAVAVGAELSVVPGPSAVTAALAVSGMPADRFVFEGFLPRKSGARRRRLEESAGDRRTVVYFAAPSRVAEELVAIAEVFGSDREVVVARELTKLHEEVFRGTVGEAARRWTEDVDPRGEFTVVIAGAAPAAVSINELLPDVASGVDRGLSLSDSVRDIAEQAGVSRRALYQAAIKARDGA